MYGDFLFPISTSKGPKMKTRLATETAESTGLDTSITLSPDVLAALNLIGTTMNTAEETDGQSTAGPCEQMFRKIVVLLWGPNVFAPLADDEDDLGPDPNDDPSFKSDGTATALQPDTAVLGLFRAGKCTLPEAVRCSLMKPRDRALFIQSREPLPAGTMRKIDDREATAVANWANGRGPRP